MYFAHVILPRMYKQTTDTPRVRQQLRQSSVASWILSREELTVYMNNYKRRQKSDRLKSKFQHTTIWSAASRPLRRLRCHPAVFFRHLRLTEPSFLQGKIRWTFRFCFSILVISLNIAQVWKFCNFELLKFGMSACC